MWWPGVIKAIHLGYGDIARQASTSKPQAQATGSYFFLFPGWDPPTGSSLTCDILSQRQYALR